MGFIYKITNTLNQKIYIGLTTKANPQRRFAEHKYDANNLIEEDESKKDLHNAMKKDGIDNFSFEIIEECPNDILNEREQYWIAYYHTYVGDPQCNGYNLTKGGEGAKGFSHTEEQKQIMKEKKLQLYKDHPEKIEEARQRALKLWEDEEYREKIIKSNKKYYEEHPEEKEKISQQMKKLWQSEEYKAKRLDGGKPTCSMKLKKRIAQLDKDTLEVIQVFDGVREAAKILGFTSSCLSKAARENIIRYGFKWKYL